jgi:hypothetical protein
MSRRERMDATGYEKVMNEILYIDEHVIKNPARFTSCFENIRSYAAESDRTCEIIGSGGGINFIVRCIHSSLRIVPCNGVVNKTPTLGFAFDSGMYLDIFNTLDKLMGLVSNVDEFTMYEARDSISMVTDIARIFKYDPEIQLAVMKFLNKLVETKPSTSRNIRIHSVSAFLRQQFDWFDTDLKVMQAVFVTTVNIGYDIEKYDGLFYCYLVAMQHFENNKFIQKAALNTVSTVLEVDIKYVKKLLRFESVFMNIIIKALSNFPNDKEIQELGLEIIYTVVEDDTSNFKSILDDYPQLLDVIMAAISNIVETDTNTLNSVLEDDPQFQNVIMQAARLSATQEEIHSVAIEIVYMVLADDDCDPIIRDAFHNRGLQDIITNLKTSAIDTKTREWITELDEVLTPT